MRENRRFEASGIDGLKLRVVEEVATFFQPDEAEKAMNTAWVLL